MVKETAIKISAKTKERLNALKKEGETFESVILSSLGPLNHFNGIEGIKKMLDILLNAGGKEHHTFGSAKESLMLGEGFWMDYHKKRADKGIKAKLIFNNSLKEWAQHNRYPKSEYKFINKSFEPLTETIIRNDKIGIIIWTKNPIGILIPNKVAAESYDKFWKIMWNPRKLLVSGQRQWGKVIKDLEDEKIKLAFYDNTIIPLLGKLENKRVLDYGGGPAILAKNLKEDGAEVKLFDISKEMRIRAGERIGQENVYKKVKDIPNDYFDFIICNLVLCIVPEEEVKKIVNNIKKSLNKEGFAYIGFCNPKLLEVSESNLDLRPRPKHKYEQVHSYKKTKKEGGYQIIENHRPIEWYKKVYKQAGLTLVDIIHTPEYELKGRKIIDFIIFKLKK